VQHCAVTEPMAAANLFPTGPKPQSSPSFAEASGQNWDMSHFGKVARLLWFGILIRSGEIGSVFPRHRSAWPTVSIVPFMPQARYTRCTNKFGGRRLNG
jgi:hypothetical protein